ncbi:MAG: hypothetical protein O9264_02800 [Leptospira sp.]|nr:hypothetical protein [Leptospira sp.]
MILFQKLTKHLTIFILLCGAFLSLLAEEPFKFVAWRPIAEASGYQVQIKEKKGKVIIDKKIVKNHYPVQELNIGDYLVRTAPLNIFQKPVVWSPWQEMEVMLSEVPRVEFYKDRPTIKIRPIESDDGEVVEELVDALTGGPVVVGPDGKPLHGNPVSKGKRKAKISMIEIDGEHFLDVTEVEISQDKRQLPILSKNFYSEKRIDVKVDTTNANPGEYDLTIINPYQKPQKVEKFLSIEKEPEKPKAVVVEVPKGRPLHTYSYSEFMAFLAQNKQTKCQNTGVPEPAISECYQTYITLNSKSKDSKDIFAFYKLISANQTDRMNAYSYFDSRCKPVFRAAKERMNEFLKTDRATMDPEEIGFLENSVKKINSCAE